MKNPNNPGDLKAVFLTRVIELDPKAKLWGVQSYKGTSTEGAGDPSNWENHYMGTNEECTRYAMNLHNDVSPNMIEGFDPSRHVKRTLQ